MENFNSGPHFVPALDLGRDYDVRNMEASEGECEEDQVKEDVQHEDVGELLTHHITVWVEHDYENGHDEVHFEAN